MSEPQRPVRVLVVDDHPVVRAGLTAVLGAAQSLDVVGEAATVAEAVSAVQRLAPDVVLMDLQLSDGPDGVAGTAAIGQLPQPPPVLILTTYDTDADILRAVEAGAAGYLLKDADTDRLVAAVHAAARGETVLAPVVSERLLSRMRTRPQDLTERELQVLAAVARGLSNRAVARQLFVSEATVKTHLVHVFGKLGVDSRTAAVAAARERGLVR